MKYKNKLSICMMVKNEEKYLEKSLSSLRPLLDKVQSELIIVDTGSEDRTVEIAKQHTAKVYFHEWNNDFASMRNKTISYATGEWILILDGDEVLEDGYNLIKFLNSSTSKKYNAGMITIKSITTEDIEDISGLVDILRLFRNTKDFYYEGAIHEQPQYKGYIFNTETVVLHYGYLATDKALMELKFNRNTSILEQELEKDPENIYYWFQLSQSYGMYKDYKKALKMNLKAYTIAKANKINLKDRMYIYTHLVRLYYLNKKYEEAEEIALEAIEVEDEYIDLYFYLGKSQKDLKKYEKAINSYKKYLEILDKYKKTKTVKGGSISKDTLEFYEDVYLDLSILYQLIDNKEEALKYAEKINKKYMLRETIPHLIKLYIGLDRYEDLKNKYNHIINYNEEMMTDFWISLEKVMMKLDEHEKNRLIQLFSIGDSNYALLNKARLYIKEDTASINQELINTARNLNFQELPVFFADIIYLFLDRNILLGQVFHNLREYAMQVHIEFLVNKYTNISETIFRYLENIEENQNLDELRFQKVLRKSLLILDKLDTEQFEYTWDKYIQNGIYYINQIYNQNIIENEMVYDVKNEEDAFLIYMLLAEKNKEEDELIYVQYLRKALKSYPNMKKGIEVFMARVNKQKNIVQNEVEDLKIQFKKNIKVLIDSNLPDEAEVLIGQYENMIQTDIEILLFKSEISLIKISM